MKNRGYNYPDLISPPDEGLAVAAFYALRYPHSTEAEWRQRIAAGQVLLNGLPASPDDVLTRGDPLVYHRPPWEEPDAPTDFATLFEDDDVLVLAKPSGLPVLPGGFFLENTLLHLVRERYGAACSPLHRLGRGTSGAILFTRNRPAARSLATAMFERRILKVYLALASGTGMPDAFTVDAPIGPVPHTLPPTVNAYRAGRPSVDKPCPGRPPVSRQRSESLLEVTIPTGRPHQIRIHLSLRGVSARRRSALPGGGHSRARTASTTNGRRPRARPAIYSTPGRSASPIRRGRRRRGRLPAVGGGFPSGPGVP